MIRSCFKLPQFQVSKVLVERLRCIPNILNADQATLAKKKSSHFMLSFFIFYGRPAVVAEDAEAIHLLWTKIPWVSTRKSWQARSPSQRFSTRRPGPPATVISLHRRCKKWSRRHFSWLFLVWNALKRAFF